MQIDVDKVEKKGDMVHIFIKGDERPFAFKIEDFKMTNLLNAIEHRQKITNKGTELQTKFEEIENGLC